MSDVPTPWPIADAVTQPFWDGCRDGRLLLQHCADCGAWQFYPRIVCVACLGRDLDWLPAAGTGTVYSKTVARRAVNPVFEGRIPLVVALVDLDEGPRMMTDIIVADPDAVRIGDRVEVAFTEVDAGVVLPTFRPVQSKEAADHG